MPISAEERAAAKKAYSEMHSRDASRVFSVMFGVLLLIPTILIFGALVFDREKPLRVWNALVSALQFGGITWMILLGQLAGYLRFQARYEDNLKVISELEQKYAAELPYGVEEAIQSEPRKKALLWRLDAFLSHKKSP
jgi:hypothetical protein